MCLFFLIKKSFNKKLNKNSVLHLICFKFFLNSEKKSKKTRFRRTDDEKSRVREEID